MTYFTVFSLLICTIVPYCYALPIQKRTEPLEVKDIQEVEQRILRVLTGDARTKRDVYEYTFNSSTKVESSVSFSMKRTETGNGQVFIIGPGENNQNFVRVDSGK